MKKKSCNWPGEDELMITYHDTEWGVPVHSDKKLFEFFVLDAFQAGLSWRTILHKRENFRKAFSNFDFNKVAKYGARERARLLKDRGIIRNRLKIDATINNAKRFLEIRRKFGTFDKYIWQFTNGKMKVNKRKSLSEVQTTSPESDAMSKDLKKRGFKFIGSVTLYAFMQAAGMVNDHVVDCARHKEVQKIK